MGGTTITSTNTALPNRSAGAAIQGYVYQFDYTILQILDAGVGTVVVEGLEDVDLLSGEVSTATQVKYLEGSHYATPATLRKPVMLMLDAFANGSDYNFILHVHFGDGSTPPTSFTPEELRACLTEHKRKPTPTTILHYEKYEDDVLDSFAAKLTIRSGFSRDEQLNQVVVGLATALGCHVNDVNELHYGNALKYVQDLAMGKSVSNRKTKRADFLAEIDKRKSLYTRWHREVIGQDRYVSQLAARIKSSAWLRSNRAKALELSLPVEENHFKDTIDIIEYLATSAYRVGRLQTTKPWTVVLDGSAERIKSLKIELLARGVKFEDGFEELDFQVNLFARPPVINIRGSTISNTSYDIRLVKIGNLQSFIDAGHQFDVVMLTTEANTALLESVSKYDPVKVLGLEQEHIKKVLQEVSR